MVPQVSGWIGVDLDRTLSFYDGWQGATVVGEPIPPVAIAVKKLIEEGIDVRIFTARVSKNNNGVPESIERITNAIQDWTEKHFGKRLPVTSDKDFQMWEIWDDRAVQFIPNTGERVDRYMGLYLSLLDELSKIALRAPGPKQDLQLRDTITKYRNELHGVGNNLGPNQERKQS